jgi:hypothetical protein
MLAALRGLASNWARHPDAQLVLKLAGRSGEPDVLAAAGLL